jgi:hypothetical protein
MNDNEIEIGLIKEKIKQELLQADKYVNKIRKHVEEDGNYERLQLVLYTIERFKEKRIKFLSMTQREYKNYMRNEERRENEKKEKI